MHPQTFYQSILEGITDDQERRVFQVLSERVGQAVTRAELICAVYGKPETAAEEEAHDRAIRKCIETLRGKDYPIVSTSSEAGYALTDDPEAIDRCVAEERSRIQRTQSKIDHLLRSKGMAHDLRQWRRGTEVPVQLRIF